MALEAQSPCDSGAAGDGAWLARLQAVIAAAIRRVTFDEPILFWFLWYLISLTWATLRALSFLCSKRKVWNKGMKLTGNMKECWRVLQVSYVEHGAYKSLLETGQKIIQPNINSRATVSNLLKVITRPKQLKFTFTNSLALKPQESSALSRSPTL